MTGVITDQYVAPPTFSTGEMLSASKMNALNDGIGYLHGWWSGPNIPYPSLFWNQDWNAGINNWYCRHAYRYLKVQYSCTEAFTRFQIFINDVSVYDDTGPPATSGTITLDLESALHASYVEPTIGDFYTIEFNIDGSDSPMTIHNVWEQEPIEGSWTAMTQYILTDTPTAAQLNNISANVAWLKAAIAGTNHPFMRVKMRGDYIVRAESPATWYVTHRHRYLHYSYTIDTIVGGDDGLELFIDGVRFYVDQDNHSGNVLVTGCVDLYSSPVDLVTPPSVGDVYHLAAESEVTGTDGTHILVLYESPEGCP